MKPNNQIKLLLSRIPFCNDALIWSCVIHPAHPFSLSSVLLPSPKSQNSLAVAGLVQLTVVEPAATGCHISAILSHIFIYHI